MARLLSARPAVAAIPMFAVLVAAHVPTADADPLPWAPTPVNACGEAGYDPIARLPNPQAPPTPAKPGRPPTLTYRVPVPHLHMVMVPDQPDNTRIPRTPLPADLCANPCPELAGGKTHTDIPIPPGTPRWPTRNPQITNVPATTAPPTLPAPPPAPPGPPQIPRVHIGEDAEPIPIPVTLLGPVATVPRPEPAPATVSAPTAAAPPTPKVGQVYPVTQLTGPGSQNRTDTRWSVNGTDVATMWQSKPGQIAIAFGDTYGPGPLKDPRNTDWRSNVLAFSSDHDLPHGMTFDSMVSNRPCHAAELLNSYKLRNFEETVIPTSGVAVGNRQYMSYMSVFRWQQASHWLTNYGGLAYSDDGGQTWIKDQHAVWNNIFGLGQFQVGAMVHHNGYVYLFGTPNGRFGMIGLARVPESDMLNPSAYQYWRNNAWAPADPLRVWPKTTGVQFVATPILSGIAGELSARYDNETGRWQLVYLDPANNHIVLREADRPQGGWSGEAPLVTTTDYPASYGGNIHPWSTDHDFYFTISEWAPYNVFLMHARIGH